MKHKSHRGTLGVLALLLICAMLLAACSVSGVPAVQIPDPEPTDVPITMLTATPTLMPQETAAVEETAAEEAVTPTPDASATSTPEPVIEYIIASGEVHSSKLNMRSAPNTNSKVIDTLYRKAELEIYGIDGMWLDVRDPDTGLRGYVYGKYVAIDGSSMTGYGFGVTIADVELRESADKDSGILRIVPAGTGVTILYADKVTGYFCVSVHDTLEEGFLSPWYMDIVARVKPNEANVEDKTGYISGNLVNFRTGPGTGYRVIDKLAKNTEIVILSVGINWYKIQVVETGVSGYVYSEYVTFTNPVVTPSPEPITLPEVGAAGYINANGVNLRSGPSADYESLGMLNKDDLIWYEGVSGNWFKVALPLARLEGWVFAEFTTFPDPTPTPAPTRQPR
ncbi:MAG TPA: SH3 domain-containing protein [Feifaniaceae bacterium]|nr:SH3 domain-containing protein [Feifaniaceae bacterium]